MHWERRDITDRRLLWFLVGAVLLFGCTSRYRLDLYLTGEGRTKKVKVEETDFIPGSMLSDPYADEKVVTGSASTAIITTGTRWHQPGDKRVFMFGFDEYLKCRVYLQLPYPLMAGAITLQGNSFVHLLGRYDLPPESKIFLPVSGSATVDSVTSKHLFASLHGRYENRAGLSLEFEGRFKVKITR